MTMQDQAASEAAVNVPYSLADFTSDIRQCGRDYGAGANSRPAAALHAIRAAYYGVAGPKDAPTIWAEFQKSAAAKKGVEYIVERSLPQQVSKFAKFFKMGALPGRDPVAVMDRAIDTIKSQAGWEEGKYFKGLSAYDNMLKVAHLQCERADHDLTDDEISEAIMPDPTEEKTTLRRLVDQYKSISTTIKKLEKSELAAGPALDIMLENCGDAIKALGGELPAVTAEEKALASLQKKAAKLGRSIQ